MTRFTGKVIAGVIGFLAFGPAGLLFGLVLGHAFDRGLWRALQLSGPEAVQIMRDQFFETTFTLLGFVAKADGRVSEAEIAQTETLFTQLRLTAVQRRTAIERFKTGSASGFDPAPTIERFSQCLGQRLQAQRTLMTMLVGIALADGSFSERERAAIYLLADLLGLQRQEVAQLISMANARTQFQQRGHNRSGGAHSYSEASREVSQLDTAYAALGIDNTASDADIKRRYRKLMSEHHPDKLISEGVPDELLKVATERAQEITAAYGAIQSARGLR